MTILGKSLWDDPRYALGTIRPSAVGFDLGSAQLPWHDLYLDGSIIYSSGAPGNLDSVATVLALGTNLATAAPTTATYNRTTGANGTTGVRLEDVPIGGLITVNNDEAAATALLKIYPSTALVSIAGLAAGANATLGPKQTVTFKRLTATLFTVEGTGAWYYDQTSGNLIFSNTILRIVADTADGADTKKVYLAGGHSESSAHGASYLAEGNEGGGRIVIAAGNIAGADVIITAVEAAADIRFQTVSLDRWYIDQLGALNNHATNGGDFVFNKSTTGIQLKSGANGRTGSFTLNGATPVVVPNTSFDSFDVVLFSRKAVAGTPAGFNLTAKNVGVSFTVTGTAGDTSTVDYILIKVN